MYKALLGLLPVLLSAVACSGSATAVDGSVAGISDAGVDADSPDAAMSPGCAGCDTDNDGFDVDVDCDDADPRLFPSVRDACTAGCGAGTRLCRADGTWSDCNCAPVCEATGAGRCFYVSAGSGNDADSGAFDAPWATYLNVVSYYSSADAPSSAVRLGPGDVVYFLDGTYDASYSYGGSSNALYFRNLHGASGTPITLRAYPGHRPVFSTGRTRVAITILQSSFFVLDGLAVRDARGRGIVVEETTDTDIARVDVTDVIGPSASNVAGIFVQSSERVVIRNSVLHDVVAEGTGGNVWSHSVILFGGGGHRLHHNEIYTTPPVIPPMNRGCVLYKHSATVAGSSFEVDHNVFRGCEGTGVGSGSFGTSVHHNLFLDSAGVSFRDFGGPTHNVDNVVSQNTFVRGSGLSYNPTDAWAPIGMTTFSGNIVIDNSAYGLERGIVTIGTYSSDSLFGQTVTAGNLTFSRNCYFNPSDEPRFNLFAAAGTYGDLGAVYDFVGWQALGYDVDSAVVDPRLDESYVPAAIACAMAGWRAR